MSDSAITIYALGCQTDHPFLRALSVAHWQVISCSKIPQNFSANSLALLFPGGQQSGIEALAFVKHFPREQVLLVLNPEDGNDLHQSLRLRQSAPWIKEIAPHQRALEEAWSQVLRAQLRLKLEENQSVLKPIGSDILALSFLASALCQSMSRDLEQIRRVIQSSLAGQVDCGEKLPWPSQSSLDSVLVACANLALEFKNKSGEDFRTRLRELSINLPFKMRSELRLAADHCFSSLWEQNHAA